MVARNEGGGNGSIGLRFPGKLDPEDTFRALELACVIHVIRRLSKCTECAAPGVNPDVNRGCWVIMRCQCRLINGNKWTTLVWDVESGSRQFMGPLCFLLCFAVSLKLL